MNPLLVPRREQGYSHTLDIVLAEEGALPQETFKGFALFGFPLKGHFPKELSFTGFFLPSSILLKTNPCAGDVAQRDCLESLGVAHGRTLPSFPSEGLGVWLSLLDPWFNLQHWKRKE